MEKSKIITDINDTFEDEINLHRSIGNTNTVEILQTIVEQYHADKSDGRTTSYPSIILSGRENSGRRTIALALNNTLCNRFKETLGGLLSMGGDDIQEYFLNSSEDTTHFINQAEHLSPYAQNVIYRILRENTLYVVSPLERRTDKCQYEGGLIILSEDAKVKSRLIRPLVNSIDVRCYLNDKYTPDEIVGILKQRIRCLGWSYADDEILRNIGRVSDGNVKQAIDILSFTYRVMRSQSQNVMTEAHLNRCLRLLNSNCIGGQGRG